MEQSRLQNIFEQIIYRAIRQEFKEKLQALGRKIIKNADVSPEETLEVLRQFVRAAFEEALCKLTPEDLKDLSEAPVEDPIPEATSNQPAEAPTASTSNPEPEEDFGATIARHILGIRTAARKLAVRGVETIDQSLGDLDAEVQVIIDGTTHTIKELAEKMRQRFQTPAKPVPSNKTDDPKNPPVPPTET